jgi:hypothetical protein
LVYAPDGLASAGCAFKLYRNAVAVDYGFDPKSRVHLKSTLPVADLELRGHQSLYRAFGALYARMVVPIQGYGVVYTLDRVLHPADLHRFKYTPHEGAPLDRSVHALCFAYGGEALTSRACESLGRRAFFRGLASVALSLAAFRRRGLMHLDVKAPNILVLGESFRLADLGLFSRAARSGGSLVEVFLEDGRCYGCWPLDFYLASPRWRALLACEALTEAASAFELQAATLRADAPLEAATKLLAQRAEALLRASGSFLRPPARRSGDLEPHLYRSFEKQCAAYLGTLAEGRFPGYISSMNLASRGREFAAYVGFAAPFPLELGPKDVAYFKPWQAKLCVFGATAAALGVELIWDFRRPALEAFARGLEAACAAPGPRGALARFGSGVDVYMLGRVLLDFELEGPRLPRGWVELACRMAALDPSLRPSAAEAALELERALEAEA